MKRWTVDEGRLMRRSYTPSEGEVRATMTPPFKLYVDPFLRCLVVESEVKPTDLPLAGLIWKEVGV